MVYALVMMAVVSIILTSAIQYVVSQTKYGIYGASKKEAFQIAEAGISFYRWYLAHNVTGKSSSQVRDFWDGSPIAVGTPACGESGAYEVEYKDPGGGAVGKYCLEVSEPADWSTAVTIKSTGWTYKYPNNKVVIRARLRRSAWSEFMILTDGMFRLNSETVINGKMHSNTGIHFDGVAYNIVTSSANTTYCDIDNDVSSGTHCTDETGRSGHVKPGVWTSWANEYNSTLHSAVFRAGKTFPATKYIFANILTDFSVMRNVGWGSSHVSTDRLDVCSSTGCYFNNAGLGRHIILSSNGTFNVCTVNSYDTSTNGITNYLRNSGSNTCSSCSDSRCYRTFNIPNNGVIYVEDNLWIEGTINGKKLSVVAADLDVPDSKKNVYLKNNLKYTNYDGSDVIGISAQNDVEFIRDSANDLRIDGALLAKEGRVGRKDYRNTLNSITINGSIASKGRINFGFTDGTGYRTRNLIYDNNLLYSPPPYYPTGSQYLLDLWEEL